MKVMGIIEERAGKAFAYMQMHPYLVFVGLLAATTDLMGALVSGTAILLVIMIMFQFYQNIAQQHAMDMNPAMRKFMGK